MAEKTIEQQLIEGKALIDTPAKWAQGLYWKGKNYAPTCYCTVGATKQVLEPSYPEVDSVVDYNILTETIARASGMNHPSKVIQFNDENTHAEVMKMWDRAIEYAHERGI